MEWLEESEKSLDAELEIANDPDKIKTQLAQHKVGLSEQSTLCPCVSLKRFFNFLSWLRVSSSLEKKGCLSSVNLS